MRRRGGTADAGKAQSGVSVSASRGFGKRGMGDHHGRAKQSF